MAAAAEEAVAAAAAAAAAAATGSGSGEWEAPTRMLRAFTWLGQEFMSDWEAQDLRAALFQLLLLWLFVSLLGIQVAWRVYGNTVTGLYYRQVEQRTACHPFLSARPPLDTPAPNKEQDGLMERKDSNIREGGAHLFHIEGEKTDFAHSKMKRKMEGKRRNECRTGTMSCPGGQNGGTPDGSSHFSTWESSSNETLKTHRE